MNDIDHITETKNNFDVDDECPSMVNTRRNRGSKYATVKDLLLRQYHICMLKPLSVT